MRRPANLWLPGSVGVAIAYVFMDIFPHLAKAQAKLTVSDSTIYGFLVHNVYLLALAGFAIYLAVILMVRSFRKDGTASGVTFKSAPVTVQIETVSVVAYNFLIGYLLAEQVTHQPEAVILFAIAMAIHFVGFDSLIHAHFPALYEQSARFTYGAGVYAGWVTGLVVEITDATLALFYSFLAGGIIVVATVYELPGIRSRKQYESFVIGAAVFSGLILAVDYFE